MDTGFGFDKTTTTFLHSGTSNVPIRTSEEYLCSPCSVPGAKAEEKHS